MSQKRSFTKLHHSIMPAFRNKINHAESTEDLKKFFAYSTQDLLNNVFLGKMTFNYDDTALMPNMNPQFVLHERLLASTDFTDIWYNSDLPHLVDRLAKSAANHYKRLEKNPGKSETKIRV